MALTNIKQSHQSVISIEYRADFYLQLARLDEAGFPFLQAIELLLKTNKTSRKHILPLQKFLKLGNTIADSGYKAGLFNDFDKALLQAGEVSGNLGIIYKQLARYYGQKVKRQKKIKSQCYLPIVVLIIALFFQPLPALILNTLSGVDYLLLSLGRLFKIALILYVGFNLSFWLTLGKLKFLGLKNLVYSVQLKFPFISSWIITRQLNAFLHSLGLMLATGLPILEALPKSLNSISNPMLKNQFDPVVLATQQGGSLADALGDIKVMDNQAIQLLLVGEQSGKLAKTLLHYVKIEQEKIDLQDDLLAEWIPRILYLLVSIWIAGSIINI